MQLAVFTASTTRGVRRIEFREEQDYFATENRGHICRDCNRKIDC